MIPKESLSHFDNAIFLPMLIHILEKDLLIVEEIQLKFKRPYSKIIDQALKLARMELKKSNIYLLRYNMNLIKFNSNKDFTEYIFSSVTFEERKKYSSEELRSRTEVIMSEYLDKYGI